MTDNPASREARAIEVLARVTERLAPAGQYVARDMRSGNLSPDNSRAITAMLEFADEAASQPREGVRSALVRAQAHICAMVRADDRDGITRRLLADIAAALHDTAPTDQDMAAFGASEAACVFYPGEDQQAERVAYCAGAASMVTAPTDQAQRGEVERVQRVLEAQMEDQDEHLPSSIARERGLVWLDGWFDLRAALAQSGDPS